MKHFFVVFLQASPWLFRSVVLFAFLLRRALFAKSRAERKKRSACETWLFVDFQPKDLFSAKSTNSAPTLFRAQSESKVGE